MTYCHNPGTWPPSCTTLWQLTIYEWSLGFLNQCLGTTVVVASMHNKFTKKLGSVYFKVLTSLACAAKGNQLNGRNWYFALLRPPPQPQVWLKELKPLITLIFFGLSAGVEVKQSFNFGRAVMWPQYGRKRPRPRGIYFKTAIPKKLLKIFFESIWWHCNCFSRTKQTIMSHMYNNFIWSFYSQTLSLK